LKIVSAKLGPFRSINTAQVLTIDPKVTVLVGMNEAGKTVALKALHKSRSAIGDEKFDLVEDYPRKDLSSYLRRHLQSPEVAVVSTYELNE
jgi:recombinational DNA repair ATPase RecF